MNQINHVEVWTEKDALSGIFKRVTEKYQIRLVVNKGYTSSSAAYSSYKRFSEAILKGQKVTILYFGDHDPSGLDMVRDIRERVLLFLSKGKLLGNNKEFMEVIDKWWDDAGYRYYDMGYFLSEKAVETISKGEEAGIAKYDKVMDEYYNARVAMYLTNRDIFNVLPIGLTKQQIDTYNLPPNPTKFTDSRAANYVKQFGHTCWEVDALDAVVLNDLIDENIQKQIDLDIFNDAMELEEIELEKLKSFIGKKE